MTPLARVEAAILKLETLKAESHSGPWWHDIGFGGVWSGLGLSTDVEVANDLTEEDSNLIVTLHSTITPMLAYLRDAAERMKIEQNQAGIPIHYRHSLALADAILGDTQ